MADLITSARAKYAIGGAQGAANLSFHADEDTTIAALITAVTKAVSKYCNRNFDSQTYDEIYRPDANRLWLRQSPISSVAWVRYAPTAVLRVTNTDTATNQRATVAVTSTGITLVRVASGTTTTDTSITFSGNATITAVKEAINALGSSWAALVVGDANNYGNWPSADLYCANDGGDQQGALDCRGRYADLLMHVAEYSRFTWEARRGILELGTDPLWRSCDHTIRVKYTAGWATIPEDVQEACAAWVAALYWQTKKNPLITNSFASAEGTTYRVLADNMPDHVKGILSAYKKRSL